MVEIAPFRGIIYNREKIDELSKVMSPPYDIISSKMQTELYNKHPNNFVRLILGKQFPNDTKQNNRYTRAKKLFETWQKEGILIKTKSEAIYPYKIEYSTKNEKKVMNGFFAILKLDPEYRHVKAHEKTLSKPKEDRLNLMKACNANLEPIELLYIDKKDTIRKKIDDQIDQPLITVKGYDGFTHKLWKIEDKKTISSIVNEFKDKTLFIADGHHRYQTAIDFANEKKKETKNYDENAPFNYRMAVLVNMFDKGLSILPTHRLIKMSSIKISKIVEDIKKYFTVEEKRIYQQNKNIDSLGKKIREEISTEAEHRFAMYCKNKYYILTLKDENIMNQFAEEHSETWRTLDVSILHKIILERIMGINESNIEKHVKYTRDEDEAIKLVDKKEYTLSFLMNPTKIEELKAVAEAGEHMPQKSTYFLPKMLSGLVIYKMG